MVVRKILESTLTAGSSSVTFTDSDIPNSLLRVYCSKSALFPISQTLSGNSITVNYKPQDTSIGVALEIVKSGLDIVDDLTTEDSSKALSANQGYVLKSLIDDLSIPDNITDLNDVSVSSIQNGQVLAWNEELEKFINVAQSGSGSDVYSTDEVAVGTYIDGKTLYRKTIYVNDNVTLGNQYDIPHGLTDIDTIVNIGGSYFDNVDSRMYVLPNLRRTYSEVVYIVCFVPNTNIPVIALQSGGYVYGTISKIRITLEYTKV